MSEFEKARDEAADAFTDKAIDERGIVIDENVSFSMFAVEEAFKSGADFGYALRDAEVALLNKLLITCGNKSARVRIAELEAALMIAERYVEVEGTEEEYEIVRKLLKKSIK